jgi:peroxiredoxin
VSWFALLVALPWLMVAVACWALYQLLLQNRRILGLLEDLEDDIEDLREETVAKGMPAGTEPPGFDLPDLDGNRVTLEQFRGRRMLVVFVAPDCPYTRQLAPDLATLPPDGGPSGLVPLLVSRGSVEANRGFADEFGLQCSLLLQEEWETGTAWTVTGSPQAYVVGAGGKTESALAEGPAKIRALAGIAGEQTEAPRGRMAVNVAAGRSERHDGVMHRDGLEIGTRAPLFRVPRLGGGDLALEDYRGRRVLLVLSDPECQPCDALMPALEQLQRAAPALAVIMVSRGSTKANREKAAEHGLTFPVGFQRHWEISQLYRKHGLTPAGYLIDEQGVIVADMAEAGEDIFSLLRRETTRGR